MVDQLGIISLIIDASGVVKLVMLILLLASIISWYMIVERGLYLHTGKREADHFESEFWSGIDLDSLYEQCSEKFDNNIKAGPLEDIFRTGYKEFKRLRQTDSDSEAIIEAVQRAMRISISREQDNLEHHLPFLASVSSVSPYIGLFGTVWGIMNSFRGLAATQQATLATVAPGISEALVATAMGLFAAIPAVLAYNRYSARAEGLLNSCETFAEEFASILYRNLHGRRRG